MTAPWLGPLDRGPTPASAIGRTAMRAMVRAGVVYAATGGSGDHGPPSRPRAADYRSGRTGAQRLAVGWHDDERADLPVPLFSFRTRRSRASCAQRAMVGFFRALSAPDDYPALVPPSNATQKTPVTGRLLQIKRPGPPSPGRLSCPGRRANSPRGARCGRPVSAAEAPANWPDRSRGAGARAFLSPPEAGART